MWSVAPSDRCAGSQADAGSEPRAELTRAAWWRRAPRCSGGDSNLGIVVCVGDGRYHLAQHDAVARPEGAPSLPCAPADLAAAVPLGAASVDHGSSASSTQAAPPPTPRAAPAAMRAALRRAAASARPAASAPFLPAALSFSLAASPSAAPTLPGAPQSSARRRRAADSEKLPANPGPLFEKSASLRPATRERTVLRARFRTTHPSVSCDR